MRHLLSVEQLTREDIERFASMYAETSPAAIRCGWGPERNRSGGSATAAKTGRLVATMPALSRARPSVTKAAMPLLRIMPMTRSPTLSTT